MSGSPRPTSRARARAGAGLWLAGSLLLLITLALPHSPRFETDPLLVLAGWSLAHALVLAAAGRRLPNWAYQATLLSATLTISFGLYLTHEPTTGTQMLYLWVPLYAFYFFSRTEAITHTVLMAAAYAVVLIEQSGGVGDVTNWVLTVGGVAVAGLLVEGLRRRTDLLMRHLEQVALTDPLTGLLNRRGFEREVEREFERARRMGGPVSIVLGDLDYFKDVNDRMGHFVGDERLEETAALLSEGVRAIDVVARLGGEEFALIVSGAEAAAAARGAERLRRGIEDAFGSEAVPLTISFGAASFPENGGTPAEILRSADAALYRAKAAGRNRVVAAAAGRHVEPLPAASVA
jgi:diguanylate cyclase (GGDEF)-like protein